MREKIVLLQALNFRIQLAGLNCLAGSDPLMQVTEYQKYLLYYQNKKKK